MWRITGIVLLILNGISACFGGGSLVLDPSGGLLQMKLDIIQYTPFDNYFFPGLILLTVLGIGSLTTAILAIMKHRWYPKLMMLEGGAMAIWIVVQYLMISMFHPLQLIIAGMGLVIFSIGWLENKAASRSTV